MYIHTYIQVVGVCLSVSAGGGCSSVEALSDLCDRLHGGDKENQSKNNSGGIKQKEKKKQKKERGRVEERESELGV